MRSICVYCSSSDAVAPAYFQAASDLGTLIAQRRFTLVYGGARVGLMGAMARAVHAQQGAVIGVIPKALLNRDVAYEQADELLVTISLRERKAQMEARADAFIALPGGFGTLEEVLEILTLKQLQAHSKPVVFINTLGFYDRLLELFEHLFAENFAKSTYRQLYFIAPDAASAIDYIETYQTAPTASKWY